MFRDWIRLTKLILPLLALLLMIAGCDGDGKPTRTLEVTVAAKGGGAAQPITPMSPPESGTAAVPPTLAARSTEEPGSKVPRILDIHQRRRCADVSSVCPVWGPQKNVEVHEARVW